jgi:hypothetical protein
MEKRLWILIEVSEQKWINDALKCGFCILKWIILCIQLIWLAPHRTCQRPVEGVRARRECIRACGRLVRPGRKTLTMEGRPRPPLICSCPWVSVRTHVYPSALTEISSCVPQTSIKRGVPAEEGNHFQPQFHGLDLSSELLTWNYLGGYGFGWMLMGCKSPL